jgi:hypothetical protein
MESASTVTALLRIGFAIVEWRNVATPIVIPVGERQFSLNGRREGPSYPIAPDNKRFVQRWNHISNRASAAVDSGKGRFPVVRIATNPYPLNLRLPISRPTLSVLRKAGGGRGIGAACTA